MTIYRLHDWRFSEDGSKSDTWRFVMLHVMDSLAMRNHVTSVKCENSSHLEWIMWAGHSRPSWLWPLRSTSKRWPSRSFWKRVNFYRRCPVFPCIDWLMRSHKFQEGMQEWLQDDSTWATPTAGCKHQNKNSCLLQVSTDQHGVLLQIEFRLLRASVEVPKRWRIEIPEFDNEPGAWKTDGHSSSDQGKKRDGWSRTSPAIDVHTTCLGCYA